MALTNPCFKDQFGLKLGRTRREERRGEEEEEEEEEKRKKRKVIKQAKVWKLNSSMDACLWYGTTWTSNALNGSPCLYSH